MTIVNGGMINAGGGKSNNSSNSQLALSDGLACYTGSFSGVTTAAINHNLNSSALLVEFKDSGNNLLLPDTWSIINSNTIEAEFSSPTTGDVTVVACIESGLAPITGGVTTIEGLSGIIDLDSSNNSITITTSGQVINLNTIFTSTSGAILEQKCRDITILSGLIGTGGGGGVASINNLSGIVNINSTNNGLGIGINGQDIELTPLFTYTSGQIIDQKCLEINSLSGLLSDIVGDAGQTSINGLSGQLVLSSPDGSIAIGNSTQTIELSGLFTATSGAVLEQKCTDIDILSGLIGVGDAGQTSINGVSGQVIFSGINNAIIINGQTITVSGFINPTSGAILEQKCRDLNTLSGIVNGIDERLVNLSGLTDGLPRTQTSVEGLSGIINLRGLNGTLDITVDGQVIQLSGLFSPESGQILDQKCRDIDILSGLIGVGDAGQTSVNGLSGTITVVSPDNTILIGDNGQSIELSGLFTQTSGAILQQKCLDITTLSGLVTASSSGVNAINGISGIVNIESPDGSIAINNNGQTIELTTSGGLACVVKTFTPTSGTQFVIEHGLNNECFTWNIWKNDVSPICAIIPENVAPSGANHAIVELTTGISGQIVFTAGRTAVSSRPVDERPVVAAIVPDTSGVYPLGATDKRFSHIYAVSGVFGSGTVVIANDTIYGAKIAGPINNPGPEIPLCIEGEHELDAKFTSASIVGAINEALNNPASGVACYYYDEATAANFTTTYTTCPFNQTVVQDSQYSISTGQITVNQNGLYRVNYNINVDTTNSSTSRTAGRTRLYVNDTTELAYSLSLGYHRTVAQAENNYNKSVLVPLNSGDFISVQGQRLSGGAQLGFRAGSSITIELVRNT